MALPLVAIVGRPNVGKSSLLNMLANRRISIVDPTAGVTRDRVQTLVDIDGVYFDLVDTGGYGIVDRDDLSEQVEQQIQYAVQQASLILFVVDAQEGLMALDTAVAEWLRKSGRPAILIANKVDADNAKVEMAEFFKLGFGAPMPLSAVHRNGETNLKERLVKFLRPLAEVAPPEDPVMKIAIVGRRNVGKSTFINALAGQERMIVSEIAGTTRDAVDVRFESDGQSFVAIDTAGVRKKSKFSDDIEYYGFHRAELSIRRADVVLFLLDAATDVGSVDKKLGAYIASQHKPCIIVVNKWDLAKDRAGTDTYGEYLLKMLPGLDYAPIAFTTAKDSKNIQSVVDLASSLFKQARTRVTTADLNGVIEAISTSVVPKSKKGSGIVKIFYATQVSIEPPTLVFFINDPAKVSPAYERFLLNRLRQRLPFSEVPVRIMFRGRRSQDKKSTAK